MSIVGKSSMMEVSMSIVETSLITMSKAVVKVAVIGLPFVMITMSIIVAMAKGVVNCMAIIMSSNIGSSSMRSKLMMGHCHVMIRLLIKTMQSMMSIISISSVCIIVMSIIWSTTFVSNLMCICLIMHVMSNFGKIMRTINCWSMVDSWRMSWLFLWLSTNSLFTIGLLILNFCSKCGLVLVRSKIVVSVWLIVVNFLMMNWTVCRNVWINFMVSLMLYDVMWSSVSIVVRESSVHISMVCASVAIEVSVSVQIAMVGFTMSIEVLVVSCGSMVGVSVSVEISMVSSAMRR